jgi:hypothetical protein
MGSSRISETADAGDKTRVTWCGSVEKRKGHFCWTGSKPSTKPSFLPLFIGAAMTVSVKIEIRMRPDVRTRRVLAKRFAPGSAHGSAGTPEMGVNQGR